MSASLTTIRVFVQWTEQTVFAGEDIECQITFKNVATSPAASRASLHPSAANDFPPGGERQRKGPTAQIKTNIISNTTPNQPNRGHRTTLSLIAPVGVGRPQTASEPRTGDSGKGTTDWSAHKRSVSIISIGASESAIDDITSHGSFVEGPRRVPRHGRSASLQITPRRHALNGGPASGNYYLNL